MRAFPFNQVKSANENGSSTGAFAAPAPPGFPFSVACGPIDAITRSLEIAFPPAGDADVETPPLALADADVALTPAEEPAASAREAADSAAVVESEAAAGASFV